MNNTLLNISQVIGKIFRGLLIAIILCQIVIGFILIIAPDALPSWFFEGESIRFSFQDVGGQEPKFKPSSITIAIIMIKMILTTIGYFIIVNEVLKVIGSIRSLETFKKDNTKAFRKMAHTFIFLTFVQIYTVTETIDTKHVGFNLSWNYVVPILICFVLAEVFKEGNKLMEENNLTI